MFGKTKERIAAASEYQGCPVKLMLHYKFYHSIYKIPKKEKKVTNVTIILLNINSLYLI